MFTIIASQAYKDYFADYDSVYDDYINIFDGFIRIAFMIRTDYMAEDEDDDDYYRNIEIELHKNQATLNRAKENSTLGEGWRRVRMDVHSE